VPRPASALFEFEDAALAGRMRPLLRRLPPLEGAPIRIATHKGLRDRHGAVHAGSLLRQRQIVFDCARSEFGRIFVHEVFHFVWLRLGNRFRFAFEELLAGECLAGIPGELGWSSEWRKQRLLASDLRLRSRRWREYCCESFCDTAAWIYGGPKRHEEYTLPRARRAARRAWFRNSMEGRRLSI
jgi:hypothetical protein